jgi:hypothetical protein
MEELDYNAMLTTHAIVDTFCPVSEIESYSNVLYAGQPFVTIVNYSCKLFYNIDRRGSNPSLQVQILENFFFVIDNPEKISWSVLNQAFIFSHA